LRRLYVHSWLIIEHNQNTSWFGRHSLDCSAGDNFRQLLISWHILLAGSASRRISAIERIQLRHELALFSFAVIQWPGFQYLPERVFTHTSLGAAFAGGLLVSLALDAAGLSLTYFL
jgi:hypothetical protein